VRRISEGHNPQSPFFPLSCHWPCTESGKLMCAKISLCELSIDVPKRKRVFSEELRAEKNFLSLLSLKICRKINLTQPSWKKNWFVYLFKKEMCILNLYMTAHPHITSAFEHFVFLCVVYSSNSNPIDCNFLITFRRHWN